MVSQTLENRIWECEEHWKNWGRKARSAMKMWGIGAKHQRKYEEFAGSAKQSMRNLREAPWTFWLLDAVLSPQPEKEWHSLWWKSKNRGDLFQKGYNFFEIHGNMNTWVHEQKFITVWIIKYEGLFATGAVWFWKNYLKHNERPAAGAARFLVRKIS